MADQDYETCDDCGKPLSEEDDFNWRANTIRDVLETADDETREALLAMFAARYLFGFVPEDHKKARRGLIREIDRIAKELVIANCDA